MSRAGTLGRPGRVAAIGLLLLALWNPSLPLGTPPLDLILLLDESASMQRSFIDRSWRETLRLAAGLPPGSRFSLIRFGGRSETEIADLPIERLVDGDLWQRAAPPRTRGVDPNGSNIEQAIRAARMRLAPDRPAAILLVSDGRETSGALTNALSWEPGATAPRIYWARAGDGESEAGPRILSLDLPAQILAGQTPPVSVTLSGNQGDRGRLELSLDGVPFLQQALRLAGSSPLQLGARLPQTGSGIHLVQARLNRAGDSGSRNDSRYATVQAMGPARILHLSRSQVASPMAQDLRRGGWPVTSGTPAGFHAGLLDAVDVIILEDLPVAALPDRAWQQIEQAVTRQGKGLIVLGGPHAFGAGGYRDSILERLLPVVAESRIPLEPAAVLFLLDKSGSMERSSGPGGDSRMMIARQAVLESAQLLQPGDRAGLIAFDTVPRALLPLAVYPDLAPQISRSWQLLPHGGTRLAPALEAAVETLARVDVEQRIILLVSDGFIEDQRDFSGVAERLEKTGIDLVALTLGPQQQNPALQRLTRINDGQLLPVTDVIQLPRLMRDQLLKRRSAIERGPVRPETRDDIGFVTDHNGVWPALEGYTVTRPKAGARIHLVSHKGDPLLASGFAGAGRVIVLPAGLDRWAPDWQRWEQWGQLLGGLVEWSNGNRNDPRLSLRQQSTPAGIELIIDAAGDDLSTWDQGERLEIRIRGPGGDARLQPALIAPGRYQALFTPSTSGLYRARISRNGHTRQAGFYYQPLQELDRVTNPPGALETALEQGRVTAWEPSAALAPAVDRTGNLATRPVLLLLTLLVYLFTLIREREIRLWFGRKALLNPVGGTKHEVTI